METEGVSASAATKGFDPRNGMMTIMAMYGRCFSTISCILALSCLYAWPQVPKPKPPTGSYNPSPHPAQSAPEITASDVEAFLDGLVPMQLQREDIAGAVIVVVKDGRVLISKGYGYADVKTRIPESPHATSFLPGSISKTLTCTAVRP